MNLNHLNLIVKDTAEARIFFEEYFAFRCVDVKGDNAIVILKNDDDFALVLMPGRNEPVEYPENFHFGFLLKSEPEVLNVYDHLKAGGIPLGREPGKIRDGFGFYFQFQNLLIEVAVN